MIRPRRPTSRTVTSSPRLRNALSAENADAVRFLADLGERLEKFALAPHPDKTRLNEFGRHAAGNREERGLGKPETFNFLGFMHICDAAVRGTSSLSGRLAGIGCG